MTTVREVEERVGREVIALDEHTGLAYYRIQQGPAYCQAIADAAFLLAEVRRLRALCGEARPYVYHFVPTAPLTDERAQVDLLAELKEAASE